MGKWNHNNEGIPETAIKYEIAILMLEKIPILDTEYLEVLTYDLTVTSLRIPPVIKNVARREEGLKKIVQVMEKPEIIFQLLKDETVPVALSQALLPNHNIIAIKAVLDDVQSLKQEINGKQFYTKLAFKLHIYTQDALRRGGLTFEEQAKERQERENQHKSEIDSVRKNLENVVKIRLAPYLEEIAQLQEEIKKLYEQIRELRAHIPKEQQDLYMKVIKDLEKF